MARDFNYIEFLVNVLYMDPRSANIGMASEIEPLCYSRITVVIKLFCKGTLAYRAYFLIFFLGSRNSNGGKFYKLKSGLTMLMLYKSVSKLNMTEDFCFSIEKFWLAHKIFFITSWS